MVKLSVVSALRTFGDGADGQGEHDPHRDEPPPVPSRETAESLEHRVPVGRRRVERESWDTLRSMKVLVTTTPGLGHVLPVLPLALELRDRGHDLHWVAGADNAEVVEGDGYRR